MYDNYYTDKISDCIACGPLQFIWEVSEFLKFSSNYHARKGLDISIFSENLYQSMFPEIVDNLNKREIFQNHED